MAVILHMFAALAIRVNLDGASLDDKRYFDDVLVILQFVAPFVLFLHFVYAGGIFKLVNRFIEAKSAIQEAAANDVNVVVELVDIKGDASNKRRAAAEDKDAEFGGDQKIATAKKPSAEGGFLAVKQKETSL